LQAGAARLYYDLSTQAIIDPVYYKWLNQLARTVAAVNVKMVCVHMQPTAAYSLVQFEREAPVFETALDISVWKDASRGR
jgi:rsbT antagonist protein RsbS